MACPYCAEIIVIEHSRATKFALVNAHVGKIDLVPPPSLGAELIFCFGPVSVLQTVPSHPSPPCSSVFFNLASLECRWYAIRAIDIYCLILLLIGPYRVIPVCKNKKKFQGKRTGQDRS